MLCLADDIITEITKEDTASGLWLKLENLYMTKSLTNKLLLKQCLFSLRMQEGMSLRDHLDQLNTILLELRNIDVKVEDEDATLIPLVSLPLSYENLVRLFIVGKDTISLEEVRSSLHYRELRHQAAGTGADIQAVGLVASGSIEHEKSGKYKSKKPTPKVSKANDVCNYCKEKGHWKSDCPKKKKRQDKLAGGATGTTAIADADSKDDIALVAVNDTHHSDVWILDSGASYHICPCREWFTTYEQVDGGKISMANSSICETVGIGSVKLRTHDGHFCTLNDVRHVPLMAKNLISLSMLDNKGFSFKGEGGILHVCKGSDVILKGVKHGILYLLQGSTLSGSVAVKEGCSVRLRCNFCGKETTGGVFRMKEHLVGGKRNATSCLKVPEDVRKEVVEFWDVKKKAKEVVDLNQFEVGYYEDDDVVVVQPQPQTSMCGSTTSSLKKPPKMRGPMDVYLTADPEIAVKKRKGKQPQIDEGAKKELRKRACKAFEKWMYDAVSLLMLLIIQVLMFMLKLKGNTDQE